MGYDYTRKFLDENAETINQLTELYNSNGVVAIEFAEQDAMNRQRQKISNVLASLALHYPAQFKDLRERVRTWSLYHPDKSTWILYVGSPRHKVAGRKPGLLPTTVHERYGPAAQTGRAEEIYSKLIGNAEEYAVFARWVAALPAGVQEVRAELVEPPDNDEFLNPFRSIGWKTGMEGPTTIVLSKPATPQGDRNA